MSVLSADDLLEQADRLIAAPGSGRPRQVDLRRGISSAYYAAFHTVATAAADEFVGLGRHQESVEHALVLRSVDHTTIRRICDDLGKLPVPSRYAPYVSANTFGPDLRAFMEAFPGLQRERHRADYDSLASYMTGTAQGITWSARAAIKAFWDAPVGERRTFLYLILLPLRR